MTEIIFCQRSLMFCPAENYSFTVRKQIHRKESVFAWSQSLLRTFGIYALAFLKHLTKLYTSHNHCCRSSQPH